MSDVDVDGQADEHAAQLAVEAIIAGRWDRWLAAINGAVKRRRDELGRLRRQT